MIAPTETAILARLAAHWLIRSAVVGYYVGEVRTVEAPHKYVYKG